MLVSLHVKNLALIQEAEVYFQEGMNILTGETGAGKSILLGAVGLTLGQRVDSSVVRDKRRILSGRGLRRFLSSGPEIKRRTTAVACSSKEAPSGSSSCS